MWDLYLALFGHARFQWQYQYNVQGSVYHINPLRALFWFGVWCGCLCSFLYVHAYVTKVFLEIGYECLNVFAGAVQGSDECIAFICSAALKLLKLVWPRAGSTMAVIMNPLTGTLIRWYLSVFLGVFVISWWYFGLWQLISLAYHAALVRRARFIRFLPSRRRDEARPFTFRNQALEDGECPFEALVSYELFGFTLSSFSTTVSASLLAELVSHKYMRPGSKLEDTRERIYRACAATGSMNLFRFRYFENLDIS